MITVQRHTLANALRIAAEFYEKAAIDCIETGRISEQFKRQLLEARALADAIEQEDRGINLTD